MKKAVFGGLVMLFAVAAVAAELKVTAAGPVGEIKTLAEANEVRVTFSEPMVVVGKIPETVAAPFFKIDPPVKGFFRWSGTTVLLFTPTETLPYATKYTVTIDTTAKSVAGNTLAKPYVFSFTTPTIQLQNTNWYRKGGKFDAPVVIALRFNQPVDPNTIAKHLQLRTVSHPLDPVPMAPSVKDPAYDAKLAKAQKDASTGGAPILATLAADWDKKRFPPAKELVVLETRPGVPPGTWIEVLIDGEVVQSARNVRAGRAQSFTIQLAPAFFVRSFNCFRECDPDQSVYVSFTDDVHFDKVKRAVTLTDVTDPAKPVALKREERVREWSQVTNAFGLDELGFSVQPARRYLVKVDPKLTAEDGQTLGYTWATDVEFWHKSAFISFGDGQGVWESSGGPLLPFHARNYRSVQQWLKPLKIEEVMPTLLTLRSNSFSTAPTDVKGTDRKLAPSPDKTQSYGLNLKPAVGDDNQGLVWAAINPGEPIPNARTYSQPMRATVVQSTNLGLTVKDSPVNTLIFVTRLDNGQPVAGANVSIRSRDNKVVWSGTTDANGLAIAPNTRNLRSYRQQQEKPEPTPRVVEPEAEEEEEEEGDDYYDSDWEALAELHFLVFAEKDGDVAYVGSDWNEGISPWDFPINNFNLSEANPLLRGTVFTDRGVYKLGEEVHFKAVLRSDTPSGMQLLPAGTKFTIRVTDSHGKNVDKRTVTLNEWSSAEWVMKVPADSPLGRYSISGRIDGQRLRVYGDFLVAAYRRPDFRVDVTLNAPASVAGTKLNGTVTGKYLFGGSMSGRDVSWTYSKVPLFAVPASISDKWPGDRYQFLGYFDDVNSDRVQVSEKQETLDKNGVLKLSLPTEIKDGWPQQYRLEAEVTDVSRQTIASRDTFRVDPAPWYIGLRRPDYFVDVKDGLDTDVIAAAIDGTLTAGVKVELNLVRIQWTSVRQSEGNGFYSWQTERKEVPAGNWTVTTAAQPAPLHVDIKDGGYYILTAKASDAAGHSTRTRLSFYAVGAGYTAWERYDHNRIDLVPEAETFSPGDTARIMIKSPWEKATALVTTEREGVRTWRRFELTSTQETISIPITEKDIPNVYVSVLLIKGRTQDAVAADGSDPGKPTFRLGYAELLVEDSSKRLAVDVKANREEYRPASKAKIEVNVKDAAGKPSRSEVTLWAVDYGVLSLTGYETPDVLDSIYLRKALQVVNEDSRQRIVSRRVLTPKGGGEGGGGGAEKGPGALRKDFRVLAFWLGSIVTDNKGRAATEVKLPESLTTYRIMAVAADKASRFGWAQNEIRINKPVMVVPAFPRFMAVGDKALFGGVVHSQVPRAGTATVTIKSLDPSVIEFTGETSKQVEIGAKGSMEVRFDAIAKSVGAARVQMTVKMGGENDAFEESIPVRVLLSPETVAAYGDANSQKPQAKETLEIPANVVPGFGGLRIDTASTAMVGLAEGARYLIEYPYGCAEQRSSTTLALMLASDLAGAFSLPGINAQNGKTLTQSSLKELEKFQCASGGFAFWPGNCWSVSPYLTSYVLHVFQRAQKLGYVVDADMMKRGYEYLETSLNEPRPTNEGWWPTYTAWQAFAVKVLVEGGRNEDSHITRLIGYVDRMPLFGISHLADALIAKNERGPRLEDLLRRMTNAILPEGQTAHVQELNDPNLLWLWSSNVRTTAIVLGTLVRHGENRDLVQKMVRWMMRVREDGRWGNTQENAWAMASLVDYYRKYEAEVPDFTAVVSLANETLVREPYKGRSTTAKTFDFSMAQVLAKGAAGQQLPVTFDRQGAAGTLFYMMRLRYATPDQMKAPMNQGFTLTRTYALQGGGKNATSFKAGDLIEVTLKVRNTKERRYVAVTDPIPAGTEPVESMFATTRQSLLEEQQAEAEQAWDWMSWWQRGGWDHVERHDDRVNVFATRLGEGNHEFKYLLRATTAGTFVTAPMHAEEMYEPEVFGRTAGVSFEVKP